MGQQTKGQFLIIGTGGIFSTDDAIQMMQWCFPNTNLFIISDRRPRLN